MAAKSDKEKTSKKIASADLSKIKKTSARSKETIADDDDFDNEETTQKISKKSTALKNKNEDDDEDEVVDDIEDDNDKWKKGEEDEDWDPDFNEFDLPKSSKKTLTGKGAKDTDDEYKVDDEFKDLFSSGSSKKKYNEDDDY